MSNPYLIAIENPDGEMHFVDTWEWVDDDIDGSRYIDYIYDTDNTHGAYKFKTNPMSDAVFICAVSQFNKAKVYVIGGPDPDIDGMVSI